jgi:hypothetical protein
VRRPAAASRKTQENGAGKEYNARRCLNLTLPLRHAELSKSVAPRRVAQGLNRTKCERGRRRGRKRSKGCSRQIRAGDKQRHECDDLGRPHGRGWRGRGIAWTNGGGALWVDVQAQSRDRSRWDGLANRTRLSALGSCAIVAAAHQRTRMLGRGHLLIALNEEKRRVARSDDALAPKRSEKPDSRSNLLKASSTVVDCHTLRV